MQSLSDLHWAFGLSLDGLVFVNLFVLLSGWAISKERNVWTGRALTVLSFGIYSVVFRLWLLEHILFGTLPLLVGLVAMLFFLPVVFAPDRKGALRALLGLAADIVPDVDRTMLVNVRAYGLAVMVLVSPYVVGYWQWPLTWRSDWGDLLAKTVLDAGVLQVASTLLLIWMARRYYVLWKAPKASADTSPQLGLVVAVLLLVALLLLTTVVSNQMVQQSLENSTMSGTALDESAVTRFVVGQLGISPAERSPSGFIMRQTVLFLMFLLMTKQPGWKNVFQRSGWLLKLLNWGLLAALIGSRLYGGRSTPRAAGVALAVGLVLFWYLVPSAIFLARRTPAQYKLMAAPIPILTVAYTFVLWWMCSLKLQFLVGMGSVYLLNAAFRISFDKLRPEFSSKQWPRSILGLT